MRYLLTLLFAALSLNAVGQVEYPYPYNPDSDSDGFIGIHDLLELLGIYSEEFNSEELYLNQDSTSLIVNVGDLTKNACYASCLNLQGNWDVIRFKDLFSHYDQLVLPQQQNSIDWQELTYMWVSSQSRHSVGLHNHPQDFCYLTHRDLLTSDSGYLTPAFTHDVVYEPNIEYLPFQCWCVTHQRPRVEYKVLNLSGSTFENEALINESAEEGWRLMPSPKGQGEQAFMWRWAE
jgi:hypothetical protein|tara:strand:+ start:336 stop:1037 length:702 start_codon:yes stop_codon:yes gene_type:complete